MIILHFDLQPQFKYMNYLIYTSHHEYHYYKISQYNYDTVILHEWIKKLKLHASIHIPFKMEAQKHAQFQ